MLCTLYTIGKKDEKNFKICVDFLPVVCYTIYRIV